MNFKGVKLDDTKMMMQSHVTMFLCARVNRTTLISNKALNHSPSPATPSQTEKTGLKFGLPSSRRIAATVNFGETQA